MFVRYVERVVSGDYLSAEDSYRVANMLLREEVSDLQAAALLVAMRTRREKADELLGFVRALRENAVSLETDLPVMDTCGTGGDGKQTFNISTAAAFVVAACGVPVAKHGNRAATSKVGSADVMEALGVRIDLRPNEAVRILETVGITFLFAPNFHPVLRRVSNLRRGLGIPTLFNFLGPLLNPFPLTYQMLGVASPDVQEAMAYCVLEQGVKRAVVVRGDDGMDEVSPCADTAVYEITGGNITFYRLTPKDVGIAEDLDMISLRGGSAFENARLIRDVLEGKYVPQRDAVVANAALALVAADKARSLDEGVMMAREAIDSGKALATLKRLISASRDGGFAC